MLNINYMEIVSLKLKKIFIVSLFSEIIINNMKNIIVSLVVTVNTNKHQKPRQKCYIFEVDAEVAVLDLNDFELPMYSISEPLKVFQMMHINFKPTKSTDNVLSIAEHNGNLRNCIQEFDWMSRN
jgi:hypothetical protein